MRDVPEKTLCPLERRDVSKLKRCKGGDKRKAEPKGKPGVRFQRCPKGLMIACLDKPGEKEGRLYAGTEPIPKRPR